MAALALRVFPGVLVTMLLAGPVFAASAQDSATLAVKGQSVEQRRPAGASRSAKAAAKSLQKSAQHAPRRRAPAAAPVTAFVDDSFSATAKAPGQPGWTQTGMASWYGGSRWQGHRTSDGSRYDQDALTAAHATLPLGTKVRVALPNRDTAVVVTITDRPGTRTRIIDLSRGAARALGILDQGVAKVTLSPG